jgi:hypothetical protein
MDSRKGGDAGLTGSAGGFVTSGTDVVVTWGAEKGDARGLFVASVGSVPSLSIDKNAFSTLFSPKAETPAAAEPPNPPKPRGLGTASVDGDAGLAAKLPNPPVMLAKPAAGVVGAVGLPKAIGTEGCPNADPLELVSVIRDCWPNAGADVGAEVVEDAGLAKAAGVLPGRNAEVVLFADWPNVPELDAPPNAVAGLMNAEDTACGLWPDVIGTGCKGGELGGESSSMPPSLPEIPTGDVGGESSRPGNAALEVSSAEEKPPRPESPLSVWANGEGEDAVPALRLAAFWNCEGDPKPANAEDWDGPELGAGLVPIALCPKPLLDPNALTIPPLPKGDACDGPWVLGVAAGLAGWPNADAPKPKPVVADAGLAPKAPKPKPVDVIDEEPKAEAVAGFANWPKPEDPDDELSAKGDEGEPNPADAGLPKDCARKAAGVRDWPKADWPNAAGFVLASAEGAVLGLVLAGTEDWPKADAPNAAGFDDDPNAGVVLWPKADPPNAVGCFTGVEGEVDSPNGFEPKDAVRNDDTSLVEFIACSVRTSSTSPGLTIPSYRPASGYRTSKAKISPSWL